MTNDDMAGPADLAPLTERFSLNSFTDDLIADLKLLRAGRISVKDAHARAELAKQVIRAIHLAVAARKFLEGVQPPPAPEEQTDDVQPPKRRRSPRRF